MPIQLTTAALERMHLFLAKDPAAIGVRFGIKRTGCSGYAYTVDLAQAVAENDSVFDHDGIRVLVDAKALHGNRLPASGPECGVRVQQSKRNG